MGGRWRTGVGALALVAVVTAAAACSKDEPAADPAPVTTAATASTMTGTTGTTAPANPANRLLDDPDAVIEDPMNAIASPTMRDAVRSYVRAEQAVLRALIEPVDPSDPNIPATREGDTLTNTVARLQKSKDDAEAYKPPTLLRVRPLRIDLSGGDVASLTVCYTERADLYRVATGDVIDGEVFSREEAVDLRRNGTGWIVTGVTATAGRLWKGSEGCAD